jgi:hypothetical protein
MTIKMSPKNVLVLSKEVEESFMKVKLYVTNVKKFSTPVKPTLENGCLENSRQESLPPVALSK